MFDRDRRLILCNQAYAALYALPPRLTRPGTPLSAILAHRAEHNTAPVHMGSYFDAARASVEDEGFVTVRIDIQDGRTIQITHHPMRCGSYLVLHEDITAQVQAEARTRHLADHDRLTGLATRSVFSERIDQALANARGGETFAIHCLGLDQFKPVNDTLGHPIGDRVLRVVKERFVSRVRETDTVARLGGDEFGVLQMGLAHAGNAGQLAADFLEQAARPILLDGHRISLGVSIGIAAFPRDGTSSEALLRHADIALYHAKNDGRNGFRFFHAEMEIPIQARWQLELDLRAALAEETLTLHYQPIVDASSHAIQGFEALLRWDHPRRGNVSPAEFIPLAEEIGLIVPLGEWVLRRACRDAAHWPPHVFVAVNLSPNQFQGDQLAQNVRTSLQQSGLPASRLELEITESVVLVENSASLAALRELRALGIRIALDDFGTGYASLSYLRSFPFNKIKIDQSFIADIAENRDSAAIVKAVAGLGAALAMTTAAEGIETPEQLRLAREYGCLQIQGHLFERAVPLEETLHLLRRRLGPG